VTSLPLKRTEYWNWTGPTPGPRGGSTSRAESFTDAEGYFLPLGQVGASVLHVAGVADGLGVTAVTGKKGVTVQPGVAVDPAGHLIALAPGGFAILDATVDPDDPRNIPTVAVPEGVAGLVVPTDGRTGDVVLTATWREVLSDNPAVSERVHAPWLRLLAPTEPGIKDQVVLARVTLDGTGNVTALSAEGRGLVGVSAERVELRRPRGPGASPQVDQVPAGELRAHADGSLALNRLIGSVTRAVLVVDAGGNIAIPPAGGDVVINPSNGDVTIRPDVGDVRITSSSGDVTIAPEGGEVRIAPTGGDVVIPTGVKISMGLTGPPQRQLHVEGQEIHSGGSGGGFSFADRTKGFVDSPLKTGARWVWYSQNGQARLWSGGDLLTIAPQGEGLGLDVARRMRVRQGGDASAGIWFNQDDGGDRAFVGMVNKDEVGFFGAGLGWGLRMNFVTAITSIAGRLEVSGQSCAASFCNLSDARLKTDVRPVTAPLRRVAALKGVTYRWRPNSGQKGQGIGVLAQDVQEEFPELVTPMGPDGDFLGVNYAGLTAVLLEAVKALEAQHKTLRLRHENLEQRVERLERRLPPDGLGGFSDLARLERRLDRLEQRET
jgi:hypothetical protein